MFQGKTDHHRRMSYAFHATRRTKKAEALPNLVGWPAPEPFAFDPYKAANAPLSDILRIQDQLTRLAWFYPARFRHALAEMVGRSSYWFGSSRAESAWSRYLGDVWRKQLDDGDPEAHANQFLMNLAIEHKERDRNAKRSAAARLRFAEINARPGAEERRKAAGKKAAETRARRKREWEEHARNVEIAKAVTADAEAAFDDIGLVMAELLAS